MPQTRRSNAVVLDDDAEESGDRDRDSDCEIIDEIVTPSKRPLTAKKSVASSKTDTTPLAQAYDSWHKSNLEYSAQDQPERRRPLVLHYIRLMLEELRKQPNLHVPVYDKASAKSISLSVFSSRRRVFGKHASAVRLRGKKIFSKMAALSELYLTKQAEQRMLQWEEVNLSPEEREDLLDDLKSFNDLLARSDSNEEELSDEGSTKSSPKKRLRRRSVDSSPPPSTESPQFPEGADKPQTPENQEPTGSSSTVIVSGEKTRSPKKRTTKVGSLADLALLERHDELLGDLTKLERIFELSTAMQELKDQPYATPDYVYNPRYSVGDEIVVCSEFFYFAKIRSVKDDFDCPDLLKRIPAYEVVYREWTAPEPDREFVVEYDIFALTGPNYRPVELFMAHNWNRLKKWSSQPKAKKRGMFVMDPGNYAVVSNEVNKQFAKAFGSTDFKSWLNI
ncbi:hypothetical protein BV898_07839 [Hypsibius exemplaris]|uniref:Uncharacterized protein n=1 Tax=Hypsibius exemplaris TaxID=2072580 RepID=A0A1W0WS86_HYPEX|nr:hypothetical protein BV898_07839 [Hypsibius exemplaris]